MLRWILRAVPWTTLIRHAPKAVDAARTLYDATRRPAAQPAPPRTAERNDLNRVYDAVDRLEQQATQQAAIVADLARQVQEFTMAVVVLRARLRAACLAGGAVGIALLVLILILFGRTG